MSDLEHYAGIDIGATNIKFGLVDGTGQILYREQKPAMVEKGAKPLLHLITNIAENLLYGRPKRSSRLTGWVSVHPAWSTI